MKKVGYAMYVHKSNIKELLNKLEKSEQERLLNLQKEIYFDYEIIKYDRGNISFIECSTWLTLKEPIVEDSHLFKKDGTYKLIKGFKTVYHSKELFVSEDYDGFDIEKAKLRTKEWNSIPNIKELKSRIGNIDF